VFKNRDIKVENILWSLDESHVVIGDFGGAYFAKDIDPNVKLQSRGKPDSCGN
jgi:serine/threonine protein kinase